MPTYHVTLKACQAMASTVGGQRRILKRKGSVLEYIRQAVESGVYRTTDELAKVRKERRESALELSVIMARFRQDIVRGSNIHDYPIEYLIHEQHPPVPDPPQTPVKFLRRLKAAPNPLAKLTKQYATRFTQEQAAAYAAGAPVTADEYYRRLLGVQAAATAKRNAGVAHKPAVLQKAYTAAVQHQELAQNTPGLSDAAVSREIDALLRENDKREAEVSRIRAQAAKNLRDKFVWSLEDLRTKQAEDDEEEEVEEDPMKDLYQANVSEPEAPSKSDNDEPFLDESLRSVFDANPAALEGMMRWSERLQAVPYKQWTIGAATTLDHWIARRLLGLSEETWLSLLEGDINDLTLMSKGQDIIAVREAVFPETTLDDSLKQHEETREAPMATVPKEATEQPELNDLFDNLMSETKNDPSARVQMEDFDFFNEKKETSTVDFSDSAIEELVRELQDYRKKHWEEGPYEEWGDSEKAQFDTWIRKYVSTMSRGNSTRKVDLEQTRMALLADPPVTKEDAQDFWGRLQDEGQATALLDTMIKDGPPNGATMLQAEFWNLPREEQVQRLLNLGVLRPLLDEYTKESDRLRFLQRHSGSLMAGMKLEHLVSDASGPISATDLPNHVRVALNVGDDDKFRMEQREYNSIDDLDAFTKSRALYRAWNEHKAGRARYEEKLFRTNRLGLRYEKPTDRTKKR